MDWADAQSYANMLLAEGLFALRSSSFSANVAPRGPGNYLILLGQTPMYIGESRDCRSRLAQQLDERRSTFYKNYRRTQPERTHAIEAFSARAMPVSIGRKELEDFGIPNLPAPLNRFQLDKRAVHALASGHARWSELQLQAHSLLIEAAAQCSALPFRCWTNASAPGGPGLYIIRSHDGEVIYVGESSDVQSRFLTHGHDTYFSAVRRNVGENLLGFRLRTIGGRKRYFTEDEDVEITRYLHTCQVGFLPVFIGRYELEEYLIAQYRPIVNRKGNM